MEPLPLRAPETSIAVIGAGRLGSVISRALRAAGFDVRGPFGRGDEVPETDLAVLVVPDAAIADAAAEARATKKVHLSGATGLDAVDLSIHPLQTFTGAESPEAFHGIGAAIDGRTGVDRAIAERLARSLGMIPFTVSDRAGYHAAASFASNFVLTVLDAAEQLAASAGVENPRDMLAPLVRRSIDNWQSQGAENALTGPIVRGDEATVAMQRAASGEHGELFDALAAATREIAATRARKDRA
jgi:predicted short-subunit dehydrogenase-like oxidoreductase (DUF2520 family)